MNRDAAFLKRQNEYITVNDLPEGDNRVYKTKRKIDAIVDYFMGELDELLHRFPASGKYFLDRFAGMYQLEGVDSLESAKDAFERMWQKTDTRVVEPFHWILSDEINGEDGRFPTKGIMSRYPEHFASPAPHEAETYRKMPTEQLSMFPL